VRVIRADRNVLALTYELTGDLAQVQLPTGSVEQTPRPLWQHTCCEIFIRRAGHEPYHELNFAPSGAWAAYAFDRYRAGAPLVDDALQPEIRVQRSGEVLELRAFVRLDRLSPLHANSKLALALATVIEEPDGKLSYWALVHGPGKPDFHDPGAFALELEAPE
jgi:hypothetical protein